MLDLQRGLRQLRTEVTAEEFLRLLLDGVIRTYVHAWGVPVDHDAGMFDRVGPLVEFITHRSDSNRIIDDLVEARPDLVYHQIARRGSQAFDWLLAPWALL